MPASVDESAAPASAAAPRTLPARLAALLRTTRADPSLRREADMMAFYLGITLLVALDVLQDSPPPPLPRLLLIIWATTLGLGVAHWFAVGLSAYLVRDPAMHHTAAQLLVSQIIMAALLASVASLAVVLSPWRVEMLDGRIAVALFVTVLVAVEARAGGRPLRRSLALGAVALALTLAVAVLKLVLALK
jgi:hypothetical protein